MYNEVSVNVCGPVQASSTYKTVILKGNHSFASQVTESNTKYVIKWDYDLNGQDIQMPANCVLDFDGGNVTNGRLISNDTEIIGILPENTNTLYGQYYHDGKPLNYNLKVTQPASTCVDFAFMAPADYVDYNFTVQGLCIFKYNGHRYHLAGGHVSNVGYLLLFDENYQFLGSCKTAYDGNDHGNAFAVCEGQIYHACGPGIVVYNISDIIDYCTNPAKGKYNGTPHSSTYAESIIAVREITCDEGAQDIDYDENNEEFCTVDANDCCRIYDKNFIEKKFINKSLSEDLIEPIIKSKCVFQGCVCKNGVLYCNFWVSDWSRNPINIDEGGNILVAYDTVNEKLVSYEKILIPYQDGESEGLFRDPDDDNVLYFTVDLSIGVQIAAFCKISQTDFLYGFSDKRGSSGGMVDSLLLNNYRVDCGYDYSNGPSIGSLRRPFTTIGTAIAMMFAKGGAFSINIQSATRDYVLPNITLRNGSLTIRKIDLPNSNVRVKGGITVNGANLTFNGIDFESTNSTVVKSEHGSRVYLGNCSISGQGSNTAVKLEKGSMVYLEHCTISDCNIGVDCFESKLVLANTSFDNCSIGIREYRSPIDIYGRSVGGVVKGVSFNDVVTCFSMGDDCPINTYGWAALLLSGTINNVITKDSGFEGRTNFICTVRSIGDIEGIVALMNKGYFSDTSIGFNVLTEELVYNNAIIEVGEYKYGNGGFMLKGYPHIRVVEAVNGGVKSYRFLPTFGSFNQRPVLRELDRGFVYHDQTLGGSVLWDGYHWIEGNVETNQMQGYWKKLGELTGNGGSTFTFNGKTVTVVDSVISGGDKWTNAVSNEVYRRIFSMEPPFEGGELLRFVIKDSKRNIEMLANYADGSSPAILWTPTNFYNLCALTVEAPLPSDYGSCNIFVDCDVEAFGGVIEVYQKV